MMNQYEFVIALVFVIGLMSVLRHRMGIRRRCADSGERQDPDETLRLRDEVKTLKERIHVLERITVEKENSLAREIESLRDR